MKGTPISGAPTFYTDAVKSGNAGYKSGKLNKVIQNSYDSAEKSDNMLFSSY